MRVFLKPPTNRPTGTLGWWSVVGGRLIGVLRKPISVACEFEYFTSYIYSVALIA